MKPIEIEIEDDALAEAKAIFAANHELIKMLNRLGRAYKYNDRRYIGRIAQTDGEWLRYKDWITRTRTAFAVEEYGDRTVLVIKHILPRTAMTYDLFEWLWASCLS